MKGIKFSLLLILSILGLRVTFAQQSPMYTQYMFNTLAVNPAYAGSRNVLSATALLRSQWIGMEGAPVTQTLSFDTSLPNKRVGLGIQAFNDKIGITRTTGVFASYAYRIRMENSTLALGLQGGVSNFRANYTDVPLDEQGQPDLAFSQNVNTYLPNFGAGVYYNTDKFYFGISAPHLLNNTLTNNSAVVTNGLIARQYLHLFITSGYVFDLSEDLKLKPSFLINGVKGAPIKVDLNANLWIGDVFSVGAQYGHKSNMSGLLEFQVTPQVRIGYAYDRSITPLVNFNSGSHEIMLRYEFGFDDQRIMAPRYF